jgi:hypothetical protein
MKPAAAMGATAAAKTNLRPLFEGPLSPAAPPSAFGFGVSSEPQWFIADVGDGGPNAWDVAHARVADQLGVV